MKKRLGIAGNQSAHMQLLAERVELICKLKIINDKMSELQYEAVGMINGGVTTGDKLRDDIIASRGYCTLWMKKHFAQKLALEGRTELGLEDLLEMETLPELPDSPLDELSALSKVGNKLCAPFPGMHVPWTQEMRDRFRAALDKFPPVGSAAKLSSQAVVPLEKWLETHSEVLE